MTLTKSHRKICLITRALKQNEEGIRRIRHSLSTAKVSYDESSPEITQHYGCLLVVDAGSDVDQMTIMLYELKQLGLKSLIIWLGHSPVKSLVAWQWLASGADDLIYWNERAEAGQQISARVFRWLRLERQLERIADTGMLVGQSLSWRSAVEQLAEAAAFSTTPILILGESGTGKEMAARMVHDMDTRPWKQMLTLLDCSTISQELSGSEFFGHEKGAFTHAINARDGALALADKGTLFLDEIGELPLLLQAELLRAVQEGTYKRIGGNQWRKTEFRLVSATNVSLEEAMAEKRFRTDLYYRISSWVIRLPTLQERVEDIPLLVEAFLKQALPNERTPPSIDPILMAYLCSKHYPGNVRELRQVVFRMASRYTGSGVISIGDLTGMDRPFLHGTGSAMTHPDFTKWVLKAIHEGQGLRNMVNRFSDLTKNLAIEASQGNLQLASDLLRITDRTLQLHCSNKPRENCSSFTT